MKFDIAVTEFSKKTGDYASLSATDIKVLSLTYQLEVEANGHEHIRIEPIMKKSVVVGPKPPTTSDKVENVAGFFMPKSDKIEELAECVEALNVDSAESSGVVDIAHDSQEEEYVDISSGEECENEDIDEEDEELKEDDDDDDEGWITPGNIKSVKNQMNGVVETITLEVACITTDFAMQVS